MRALPLASPAAGQLLPLLLLFVLPTTVFSASHAPTADTVRLEVACELPSHQSPLLKEILMRAAAAASVHLLPLNATACYDKHELAARSHAVIYINNELECGPVAPASASTRRLTLAYNADNETITTPSGTRISAENATYLDALIAQLAHQEQLAVAAAARENKKNEGLLCVPVAVIMGVGVVLGVLVAGNCILCSKLRVAQKRAHALDGAAAVSVSPSPAAAAAASAAASSASSSRRAAAKKTKSSPARSSKSASSSSLSSSRSGHHGKKPKSAAAPVWCRSSKKSAEVCSNSPPTSVKVVSTAATGTCDKREPERSMARRVEMPMTEDEFKLAMRVIVKFAVDYYNNPQQYTVGTGIRPNEIFNKLPANAPENPERFEDVWKDFNEIILDGFVHWQHPQFHAFFPSGRCYPDILAETLISSLGTVGFTWAANPAITELDTKMVNWMGCALGIPPAFHFRGAEGNCQASDGGGWIADTASDAIFCAVMAARHCKLTKELEARGVDVTTKDEHMSKEARDDKYKQRAEIIAKLVAYGSKEAHSSFEKACKMALVRCRPILVSRDFNWGMQRAELEHEMEKDTKRGLIPFYVHVAVGTTSTAAADNLAQIVTLKLPMAVDGTPLPPTKPAPKDPAHPTDAELQALARPPYDVWMHVDAAYAGGAWVAEEYREDARGLEGADSININLHKLFLTSTSVTLFWTKKQREYKACFSVDPAYLKKNTGAIDLRDWGVQLSRRFKSLKVYMLLRMYGLNGMRAYIRRLCEMTLELDRRILALPNMRKFGATKYGLFCVQYWEPEWDEKNDKIKINLATKRLCEHINLSRRMVLTHSNVHGHDIIRVAVNMERSKLSDIEESASIFSSLLKEFMLAKAANPSFLEQSARSAQSHANLLQQLDLGIVGSPNTSKSATNIVTSHSSTSMVGGVVVAYPSTSLTLHSTLAPSETTQQSTTVTALTALEQHSCSSSASHLSAAAATPLATAVAAAAAPAAAPEATPARAMPPLQPAAFDGKDKSNTSSYGAPINGPPPPNPLLPSSALTTPALAAAGSQASSEAKK